MDAAKGAAIKLAISRTRIPSSGLAVIKGYTKGRLISTSHSVEGQFSMDISKLESLIDYPIITRKSLEDSADKIGVQLRDF